MSGERKRDKGRKLGRQRWKVRRRLEDDPKTKKVLTLWVSEAEEVCQFFSLLNIVLSDVIICYTKTTWQK